MLRTLIAGTVLAACLAAAPAAWSQTPTCPASADEAARIAISPEPFSDKAALVWSTCPIPAARMFAAAYLAETDPTPKVLGTILKLVDDPSDRVRLQAFGAMGNQAEAMIPYLEKQLKDRKPSSIPGLTQGDLAAAALEALDPQGRPLVPYALRNNVRPAKEAPPERPALDYEHFMLIDPPARAAAMHDAAMTEDPISTFQAIQYAARYHPWDATPEYPKVEDYESAALTAFRRALAETPETVIKELRDLLVGIPRSWGSGPNIEQAVLAELNPDSLLAQLKQARSVEGIALFRYRSEDLPENWAGKAADIEATAQEIIFLLIEDGQLTQAMWSLGEFGRNPGIDIDNDMFVGALVNALADGLVQSSDINRMLQVRPEIRDSLSRIAGTGGASGDAAGALLACADSRSETGEFVSGDPLSCYVASQIMSGLSPSDGLYQSYGAGDICRAAAFAAADPAAGEAFLWDIRTRMNEGKAIGVVPAPSANLIECGTISLYSFTESILREIDRDKFWDTVRAGSEASAARHETELAAWDGIQPWDASCRSFEMDASTQETGTDSPLKAMLSMLKCFETKEVHELLGANRSARHQLKTAWAVTIPPQTELWNPPPPPAPAAPMSPDPQDLPVMGPGGLPVIKAMPKPRLEVALDLSRLGGREQTLESLQGRIESALRKASPGYETGLFSDGKDGIIILTRRERIRSNGEPFDEARRFTELGNPKASLADLFSSIIREKPGEFRVIAFVIARDINFDPDADPIELPLDMIGEVRSLPPELAGVRVGDRKVTALVYVFERPKGKKAHARKAGPPSAYQHLLAAGIWSALGLPK